MRGWTELRGRRIVLRPLEPGDWAEWAEVRIRCRDWLERWEPKRDSGRPDPALDRSAFVARCQARDRDRELGSGYGFGLFVDERFAGEVNLGGVQWGAFRNGYVGYWIDRDLAGRGYVPEALVVILRYAFEDLGLHRVQVSIVPRNEASRRVVEKLDLRSEGVAERYLEIAGAWEDHIRYAMTTEEWTRRSRELSEQWLAPVAR